MLTKEGEKWTWRDEKQAAFETLKECITFVLVLDTLIQISSTYQIRMTADVG